MPTSETPAPPASRLDGPLARITALAVFLMMAAALGYIHRDDLFPPEAAAPDPNDPVALCFAERAGGIGTMLADGTINESQAALFKSRAEALCQAQFGGNAAPGLPPQ